MRTITLSLVVLSAVMISAASCSSSDTTPAPAATGGSAGSAGSAGTGGSAGAAGASGGAGMAGAAGAATDQCTNATDMAAVQATYTVGDAGGVTVPDIAAICGKGCLGNADAECTTKCIVQDTGNAVSSACAGCFSASVKCTVDNCLSECISDSTAPKCVACRCGTNPGKINCYDAYTACSGIPNTGCVAPDGGSEGGSDASNVDAAGE